MKQTREFTEEDRDWLIANYPHHTNRACLEHLKVGYKKLKEWIAACGLEYRHQTHENTKVKLKNRWKEEPDKETMIGNYCIDCSNYVKGGTCSRNGKTIGALWQKKCFKREA